MLTSLLRFVLSLKHDQPARIDEREQSLLAEARTLMERDEMAAAKSKLDEAIASNPCSADAYLMRASLFGAQRAFKAALRDYAHCIEMEPASAAAHMRKGEMHFMLGEFDQALQCAQRVLVFEPANSAAQRNLGLMLRELGCLRDAEIALRQSVVRNPENADVHCALAMVLIDLGLFQEADQHLDGVLRADSKHNEARWLKAVSLLLRGDFRRGWAYYDSRLQREDARACRYHFPEWDGRELDGTLLIYAEQGLGDDILFASCIADARRLAKHCVVESDRRLVPLFQRSFPGITCIGSKDESHPRWPSHVSPISAQIAAGSLPRLFRNEWDDFPKRPGYLIADNSKVRHWNKRLEQLGPGLKVGISWTGGGIKTRRRARSVLLRDLLPVLRERSVRFVSLQYVDSSAEIESVCSEYGIQLVHWQDAIADYDETAALVSALDLVISVCTSVVHLAGALGKTAWVMVPATPEWRYLYAGDGLPWYPAVRLFRQTKADEWASVVAAVSSELHKLSTLRQC